jgi:hypothetical protein
MFFGCEVFECGDIVRQINGWGAGVLAKPRGGRIRAEHRFLPCVMRYPDCPDCDHLKNVAYLSSHRQEHLEMKQGFNFFQKKVAINKKALRFLSLLCYIEHYYKPLKGKDTMKVVLTAILMAAFLASGTFAQCSEKKECEKKEVKKCETCCDDCAKKDCCPKKDSCSKKESSTEKK